jgi:hypothetical protein
MGHQRHIVMCLSVFQVVVGIPWERTQEGKVPHSVTVMAVVGCHSLFKSESYVNFWEAAGDR